MSCKDMEVLRNSDGVWNYYEVRFVVLESVNKKYKVEGIRGGVREVRRGYFFGKA